MADLRFSRTATTDLVFGAEDGTGAEHRVVVEGAFALPLSFVSDVGIDHGVARGLSARTEARWGAGHALTKACISLSGHAPAIPRQSHALWERGRALTAQAVPELAVAVRHQTPLHVLWERGASRSDRSHTGWVYADSILGKLVTRWEPGAPCGSEVSEGYSYPPQVTQSATATWEVATLVNRLADVLYSKGLPHRIARRSLWEVAGRLAPGLSDPPVPVDPDVPALPPLPPLDLIFTTRWQPTGYRALVFGQPEPASQPTGVIVLMPTVTLSRLSDGAELAATDVSWQTDADSWCWSFTATLQRPADIALVKPDTSGRKEIACEINGHRFTGMVERYSRTRSFSGGITYRIEGRSRSAAFAAPFARQTSGVFDTALTARQIIETLIQNSGWTLDWQINDWLIPADTLSWATQTPMQLIKQVVAAVGAVVQSHPELQVLSIRSRYPVSPWHWAGASPKAQLPASLIRSDSGEFSERPLYNGAIIGGVGGIVRARLDGTAGEITPPDVINPLLSSEGARRERARVEIAQGGAWESVSAVTWLTQKNEVPGLLLPGDLVEVVDTSETYRMQIEGVGIGVTSSETELDIKQTIQGDRRYG